MLYSIAINKKLSTKMSIFKIYDVLCVISDSLDIHDMISFRLLSEMFNEVFLRHWIYRNILILKSSLIKTIPEWLHSCKVILKECIIYRDIFLQLPIDTIFHKSDIFYPLLNQIHRIEKEFIIRIKDTYGFNFSYEICNCGLETFCGEEYCLSLDLWLPEFKSMIPPNRTEMIKIIENKYPRLHINSMNRLLQMISNSDKYDQSFLLTILCMRNDCKSERWKGYKSSSILVIKRYLSDENFRNNKYGEFFENSPQVVDNI